jgi:hypothetical protein
MQWIPAFAGMTVERAWMTVEGTGMTVEGTGMTVEGPGMTVEGPGTVETSFRRRPIRRIGTPHRAESREVALESFLRRFPVFIG